MSAPQVSIIIPAFNEAGRIQATVEALRLAFDRHQTPVEILVIDDGSTDNTGPLAAETGIARAIRQKHNLGKGAAIKNGFHHAQGEWIVMSDADLSVSAEQVAADFLQLRNDDVLVIGSRSHSESRIIIPQPLHRQWMGKGYNAVLRALTNLPYRDTQCGYKWMKRETLLPIIHQVRANGWSFDAELVMRTHRANLPIREIPVIWKNGHGSKVRFSQSLATLLELLRLK